MTDNEIEMINAVRLHLRVPELSMSNSNVHRLNARPGSETESAQGRSFLNLKIGNHGMGDVLSKVIFGIGMFFVALFTTGIAASLPDRFGKIVFFAFSALCLLVAAYQMDVANRCVRLATGAPNGTNTSESK